MDFRFTDEQRMLQETAGAFLADVSDSAATRRAMQSALGFDAPVWQRLCEEMYWQGILVPERCGGLGLGFVDVAIVLEKMGERLHCSPLFASVWSSAILRSLPEGGLVDALQERLLAGMRCSVAHTAARPEWSAAGCAISAHAQGDGFTLSGEARFIPCGHAADGLLVLARLVEGDGESNGDGFGLFWLETAELDARTGSLKRDDTMDQTRPMASLQLESLALGADRLLSRDVCIDAWIDLGRILLAADQVGGAQASLDSSVAYSLERVQFGRPVGSFQAIKHKAADMMLKVESGRSLLYYAACVADEWAAGSASATELAEAAAMVAACAGEAYFFNAGTGIQIHGGVGITEEYDIQLYFKRARATESYLGSPSQQRETLAAMLLDGE